jgi:putative tryptophan/tyrosine transport system substrate-binding protein
MRLGSYARLVATTALLCSLLAALVAPGTPEAQPGRRLRRVGYVTSERRSVNVEVFEQRLRELGYVLGDNVEIDYRFGEGHAERVPALVAEVLKHGVDVLLAANPHVIRAARAAGATIPIVAIDLESDPVAEGWVKSLARPGGNLTGFFLDIPELSGKQLQFLTEARPKLQRVGIVWDSRVAGGQFRATERAAQAAGLRLQSLPVRGAQDLDAVFQTARREQTEAIVILSSPSVFNNLGRLADLSLQLRLPAISVFPEFANAGGLMGYGPTLPDLFRQSADYVSRILKGEAAGDLPVQRPVRFKLVVNLKTANALGLAFPPSVLARADTVIPRDPN